MKWTLSNIERHHAKLKPVTAIPAGMSGKVRTGKEGVKAQSEQVFYELKELIKTKQ